MTVQATWYAFNDDQFRGFQTTVGVVGPASLAKQTQKTVHTLLAGDDPRGWDNQLSSELVVNVNAMYKKKLWQMGSLPGLSFDTSASGNVVLGNMFTQGLASLEMRFGRNIPRGFVYVLDPIGYSMQYDAACGGMGPRSLPPILGGTSIAMRCLPTVVSKSISPLYSVVIVDIIESLYLKSTPETF